MMLNVLVLGAIVAAQAGGLDGRAQTLMEQKHWKQARQLVEAQFKSHPGEARLMYLMSQVKMAFGDLDDALRLAERALESDGTVADYHNQVAMAAGRPSGMRCCISVRERS